MSGQEEAPAEKVTIHVTSTTSPHRWHIEGPWGMALVSGPGADGHQKARAMFHGPRMQPGALGPEASRAFNGAIVKALVDTERLSEGLIHVLTKIRDDDGGMAGEVASELLGAGAYVLSRMLVDPDEEAHQVAWKVFRALREFVGAGEKLIEADGRIPAGVAPMLAMLTFDAHFEDPGKDEG